MGAASGSYETAILIEWCKMHNIEVTGGVTDVYKCFDQIIRTLLKEMLKAGGMPTRVLEPYMKSLDKMMVHNTLAGQLGEGYGKPCSIPQGCPFSMMAIAFMMRPWLLKLRSIVAEGRVLADDILLTAKRRQSSCNLCTRL